MNNPAKLSANLYVIAAPSGSGKTSLVKHLIQSVDNIQVSISHTTRGIRPGEVNGKDYHFVDELQFKDMIEKQLFLEHAFVHGHFYGTSKQWIEDQLRKHIDIILEIDWQGACAIRKLYPQAISIFIMPPSEEALRERLSKRNQDHEEVIAKRLAAAHEEVSHYRDFDYLILNDTFEHALRDLKNIVYAERLRLKFQEKNLSSVLALWNRKF